MIVLRTVDTDGVKVPGCGFADMGEVFEAGDGVTVGCFMRQTAVQSPSTSGVRRDGCRSGRFRGGCFFNRNRSSRQKTHNKATIPFALKNSKFY